jgi:hypothetical protein
MPLSTLRSPPRGNTRKTQGHDGSLLLSCRTLSRPTTCWFIPAYGHDTNDRLSCCRTTAPSSNGQMWTITYDPTSRGRGRAVCAYFRQLRKLTLRASQFLQRQVNLLRDGIRLLPAEDQRRRQDQHCNSPALNRCCGPRARRLSGSHAAIALCALPAAASCSHR